MVSISLNVKLQLCHVSILTRSYPAFTSVISGGEVTCLYRSLWHCRECDHFHAGGRWGRTAWGTPRRQNSADKEGREGRDLSFVSAAVHTCFPLFNTAHNMMLIEALVKKSWRKTHMIDNVKDWLEDDDVAVARSLRKLLLLLHVILPVVDVLVVLLRHSA